MHIVSPFAFQVSEVYLSSLCTKEKQGMAILRIQVKYHKVLDYFKL